MKKIFVYLFIFVGASLGVWFILAVKNCYPRDIFFPIYISSNSINNSKSVISTMDYNTDKVFESWMHNDPISSISKNKIVSYINIDSISEMILSVGPPQARCDFNDSYTKLNPSKLKLSIDNKNYDFSNQTGVLEFTYKITDFTKSYYPIHLSYDGKFNTEYDLEIYPLSSLEFEKKKVEVINNKN